MMRINKNQVIGHWRAAIFSLLIWPWVACQTKSTNPLEGPVLEPVIITEQTPHDTDDPAIWIDSLHPERSLIVGTDKDTDGGLYVYDLNGKINRTLSVTGLKRPNNVDIEYGFLLNGKRVDIAVVTERLTHKIRVFQLPDMKAIDGGGLSMFEGETGEAYRDLMGIGLYRDANNHIYAIVGRKNGPKEGSYLWQYWLTDNGQGQVQARLVRKFGKFSGTKEIESILVDDRLGYIYCSDEGVGIRKYYADTVRGNDELALFAQQGFAVDHEGISLYETSDSTGYLLVSDQGVNRFHIFPREGSGQNPHQHPALRTVRVQAQESDGSEMTSFPLGSRFPKGLFVVMSTDKTFHYYLPEKILGDSLLRPTD